MALTEDQLIDLLQYLLEWVEDRKFENMKVDGETVTRFYLDEHEKETCEKFLNNLPFVATKRVGSNSVTASFDNQTAMLIWLEGGEPLVEKLP